MVAGEPSTVTLHVVPVLTPCRLILRPVLGGVPLVVEKQAGAGS
jgi:hypothetical protein